jgi:hypothetical protein
MTRDAPEVMAICGRWAWRPDASEPGREVDVHPAGHGDPRRLGVLSRTQLLETHLVDHHARAACGQTHAEVAVVPERAQRAGKGVEDLG